MGGDLALTSDGVFLSLPDSALTLPSLPLPVNTPGTPSSLRQAGNAPAPLPTPRTFTTVQIQLDGAARPAALRPETTLPGMVNLFLGPDPKQWHARIPTYASVLYPQVYPGVDLRYEGSDGHIKSTFLLAPGADPTRIRWRYQGASRTEIDANGNLLIWLPTPAQSKAPARHLTEGAPVVWQERDGQRVPVGARYTLTADGAVGVRLDRYDARLPLWLDPVLAYNVSLGGGGIDAGYGIALDPAGRTYLTGAAGSGTFPWSAGQPFAGFTDAFVTKLLPSGQGVEWSTFFGGNGYEFGQSIVIDAAGQVSIAGFTVATSDLPLVDAQQTSAGGNWDGFAATFSANGQSLLHSTYIGGSSFEYTYDIAVAPGDASAVYIIGLTASTDFPVTTGAYATTHASAVDAFVTKLSITSSAQPYATFLGGTNDGTQGHTIAVDAQGNAYAAGQTKASNYPVTSGAADTSFAGGTWDAFVTKLNPQGTQLVYSTFIGGNGIDCEVGGDTRDCAIVVDAQGAAYLAGTTTSTDLPTTSGAYQDTFGGNEDLFVAKLTPQGTSFDYLTYLGGSGDDIGRGLAVDSLGRAIVTGDTTGSFPTLQPIQATFGGNRDVIVAQLAPDGDSLVWSTYLGTSDEEIARDVATGPRQTVAIVGSLSDGVTPSDVFVARLGETDGALPADQVFCPRCHPAHVQVGRPIDTRTGNVWTDATDLSVAGAGPPLVWYRAYASQRAGAPFGPLGSGWSHPYATQVLTPTDEAGVALLIDPQGNRLRFRDDGNGSYTAFPGIFGTLVGLSGGGYEYSTRDQIRWVFNTTGLLQEEQLPQGGSLSLSYAGTPARLARIADTNDSSRALDLTYNPDGYVETVSDGARTITYAYTYDDLTDVSDVMQRTTTYYYDYYLLTGIDNALGEPVERTAYDVYASSGRAIQQTLQDGRVLDLQYLPSSTIITTTASTGQQDVQQVYYDTDGTVSGQAINGEAVFGATFDTGFVPTTVYDGNAHATTISNTAAGLPAVQTDALGQTTRVSYDSQNRPITVTDALNISTVMAYDTLGNVISTTMGITTSSALRATSYYTYSYDVRFVGDSQLTDQSGPDGVVTHSTYTSAGQVETVTVGYGTALAQTTRYGYDGRGRRTHTTTGDGTALERIDVTVYNDDDTVDQTIQNYGDGVYDTATPDEDIVTRSGYDGLGRQIWSQDTLGAYASVTHYNTKGQVDWAVRNPRDANRDPILPMTLPSYDPAQPDANVVTAYGYDGLGRTVLVTETGILTGTFDTATRTFSDATERVTRTEYDALSRPVTVTLNYVDGAFDPLHPDEDIQTLTYYDGAGNVIWQRDALSRWTKTDYDALNRPFKTIANYVDGDPATLDGTGFDTDLITVQSYDILGRGVQEITNYVDGTFDVQAPTDDRSTRAAFDSLGRVITTTSNYDPATLGTHTDTNRISLTAYDPLTGRTLGQRDPLGRWASQQYDLIGRGTHTIQNCRDGANQAVATGCASFDANLPDRNVASETQYDAVGRAAAALDALGHRSETSFDRVGRVTATIQNYDDGVYDANTPDADVITSQSFNGLGQTIASTNAVGASEQRAYDGLGQVVQVTDAASRISHLGYDGTGVLRWQETPDGRFTVYQIDGLGRVVATITNYDDGVVQTSDGNDQDLVTRTLYDATGRQVAHIDAADRRTAFAYDLQDRLLIVTENVATGTCTTAPCDIQTTYAYDRAGNRTTITDANNHTRTFAYDAADQQTSASDALQQVTTWEYDAGGRATAQRDPRGADDDLSYNYDDLDRRTGISAVDLDGPITLEYNALGWRTALIDPIGTTSFAYDALGRMTDVDAPETGHVGYGHDGTGRRTALTYPNGRVIDYAYTAAGELQTVAEIGTPFVTYTYDQAGRPFTETRANGTVITRTYDLADRLQDLHAVANGTTLSQFEYSVDRNGQRTGVAETLLAPPTGNGTGLQGTYFSDSAFGTAVLTRTDATIDFDWDQGAPDATVPSDQFSVRWTGTVVPRYSETYTFSTFSDDGVTLVVSGTTLITDPTTHGPEERDGAIALTAGQAYSITLAYFEDVGGAVVQLRWASPSQPRELIPTSQLYVPGAPIAAQGTTPLVQTRAITYTYDGLQRLTGADVAGGTSSQYAYDDAGNRSDVWLNSVLVSHQTYNAANQVDGFTYDAVGNLLDDGTTASTYDTLNRLRRTAASAAQGFYDYNGDGVLIARSVNSNFTRFSQDLALPLHQILQTSWSSDDTFIYGAERLAMTNAWGRSWYGADGLDSVRQSISDSGLPLGVVDYDPWGVPEQALGGIFGFTGELQEAETGRVYLRARWYTPATGRFTARDPFAGDVEQSYSQHPYQYAYSDPGLRIDPSGQRVADNDDSCQGHNPRCLTELKVLGRYGLGIEPSQLDKWQPNQLATVRTAIEDLMHVAIWTAGSVKRAFTPHGGRVRFIRILSDADGLLGHASILPPYDYVKLYPLLLNSGAPALLKLSVVHELSHIWSYHDPSILQNFVKATGGFWGDEEIATGVSCQWGIPPIVLKVTQRKVYHPHGSSASTYGGQDNSPDPGEDWAEAVAGTVYKNHARYTHWSIHAPADQRLPNMDEERANFVRSMFRLYR